jgi:cellulose biosynthesis protein BcsQ
LIENLLLIENGKGGVGKTSLVANLAGLAAAAGWRVLAIDLDPQGNLARDLGYLDRSDGGSHLAGALINRTALIPIFGVRPSLDVIPGGPALAEVTPFLIKHESTQQRLSQILAPLSSAYDLIVADLPPGEPAIRALAAQAARWIVIPTKTDPGSIDGLNAILGDFIKAHQTNQQLRILGIALMLVNSSAKVVLAEARQDLNNTLRGSVPIFNTAIRSAEAVAVACRQKGMLVSEYAAQATVIPSSRFASLRAGKKPERFLPSSTGLASDYVRLVNEVLTAIKELN